MIRWSKGSLQKIQVCSRGILNSQGEHPQRPQRHRLGPLGAVLVHLERTIGAGFLVMLPIAITVLVLKFFFDLLDPILQRPIDLVWDRDIPGLGLAALAILIYLAGLIAAFVLGRRAIDLAHRAMEVIPLVKGIYSTTRAAVGMLSTTNEHRYSGVVLIDFPRPGIRSIGLITARMNDTEGEELLAVYIPTTPIPSSGFLVIAPVHEVTLTDMSVDEAMRIVISGGILSSRVFQRIAVGTQDNPRSNQ